MLLTVLQFVPDAEVSEIVGQLVAACAPGSFVAISHPASDIDAEQHTEMVRRMNESMAQQVTLRDREGVTRLFEGLELAAPGVVRVPEWRPDTELEAASPAVLWVGVARKPRLGDRALRGRGRGGWARGGWARGWVAGLPDGGY